MEIGKASLEVQEKAEYIPQFSINHLALQTIMLDLCRLLSGPPLLRIYQQHQHTLKATALQVSKQHNQDCVLYAEHLIYLYLYSLLIQGE